MDGLTKASESIRRRGAAAACLVAAAVLAHAAAAAPKAELWSRWTAHDATSSEPIDHEAWSRMIGQYLVRGRDGVARFAYGRVTDTDQRTLASYVDALSDVSISEYNCNEQLAYWINLYNALTVKLVLAHYPVSSITKIKLSGGFFAFGPWDEKLATVEGQRLSLNDIEHRILRPIWQDPRVHYAVNCASVGCPNLRDAAYTAKNVQTLLDEGAREYINNPRGARFIDRELVVSSIYHWFKSDFGGSDQDVIAHLRRYAGPELTAALRDTRRIGGYHYDWSLNDAASLELSTVKLDADRN